MVENLELPDGTNTVEASYEVNENNKITILITILNSETTTFAAKIIKLEPVDPILKIILQKGSSNRKELMESALRLSHLQPSEKKVLSTLLYEFLDHLFLPGDKLEKQLYRSFMKLIPPMKKLFLSKITDFPKFIKKR